MKAREEAWFSEEVIPKMMSRIREAHRNVILHEAILKENDVAFDSDQRERRVFKHPRWPPKAEQRKVTHSAYVIVDQQG